MECDVCGEEFASEHGVDVHKGAAHDMPWQDEDTLREMYLGDGMSTYEIADELDTSAKRISKWLGKFDIEARDKATANGGYNFSKQELARLYHQDRMTTVEIGDEYGIDPSCVNRQMDRMGIERRDPSEYDCPTGEDHWAWERVEAHCGGCGEAMEVRPSRLENHSAVYCSSSCKPFFGRKSTTGKETVCCDTCGSEIERWPSMINEYNYCNPDCGSEGPHYKSGEDHHRFKGAHGDYCGPNWQEKRKERLEFDGYGCVVCGMSQEQHREKWDVGLHVHHIKPRRDFRGEDGSIDWGEANDIENLVSLCASCHQDWEYIPVQPQIQHPVIQDD